MKLNNKYYILRHGEAMSNVEQVISSWPETFENPLTDHAKETIQKSAQKLKDKHINLIFASDLLRTKQTAEIVAKELNLKVEFDTRLREINFGDLSGKPIVLLDDMFHSEAERISNAMPGGETYEQVTARTREFLKDIDVTYSGKTILIVSHESVLWMMECIAKDISLEEGLKTIPREKRIHKGEIRELN